MEIMLQITKKVKEIFNEDELDQIAKVGEFFKLFKEDSQNAIFWLEKKYIR